MPTSNLFSTLQLCAVQDDRSYLNGSFFSAARVTQQAAAQQPVIYVGTSYCERSMHGCSRIAGNTPLTRPCAAGMEQLVFYLAEGATLVSHALYRNSTIVPLSSGACGMRERTFLLLC